MFRVCTHINICARISVCAHINAIPARALTRTGGRNGHRGGDGGRRFDLDAATVTVVVVAAGVSTSTPVILAPPTRACT